MYIEVLMVLLVVSLVLLVFSSFLKDIVPDWLILSSFGLFLILLLVLISFEIFGERHDVLLSETEEYYSLGEIDRGDGQKTYLIVNDENGEYRFLSEMDGTIDMNRVDSEDVDKLFISDNESSPRVKVDKREYDVHKKWLFMRIKGVKKEETEYTFYVPEGGISYELQPGL